MYVHAVIPKINFEKNSFRVPTHLENFENLENEKIKFPGLWKSWEKEKQENVMENFWKFSRNAFEIITEFFL